MNLKRLSIQLPQDLHQAVKLIAHLERETITSLTIRLLSEYAEDKKDLLSTIQLNNERI